MFSFTLCYLSQLYAFIAYLLIKQNRNVFQIHHTGPWMHLNWATCVNVITAMYNWVTPGPSLINKYLKIILSFLFIQIIASPRRCLYFLQRLKKARLAPPILSTFYTRTIEINLISCLTLRYRKCTVSEHNSLQRVVRAAEKVIGVSLPTMVPSPTTAASEKPPAIQMAHRDSFMSSLPSCGLPEGKESSVPPPPPPLYTSCCLPALTSELLPITVSALVHRINKEF